MPLRKLSGLPGKGYLYLVLGLADMGVFLGVNPQRLSAPLMMVAFVMFVATIYLVLATVITWSAKLFSISPAATSRLKVMGFLAITFLTALQSIGQLTFRDVLAIFPLIGAGYFYLTYPSRSLLRSRSNS